MLGHCLEACHSFHGHAGNLCPRPLSRQMPSPSHRCRHPPTSVGTGTKTELATLMTPAADSPRAELGVVLSLEAEG